MFSNLFILQKEQAAAATAAAAIAIVTTTAPDENVQLNYHQQKYATQ